MLTGLIDGLSVTLQNNDGDDHVLTDNGAFNFVTEIEDLDDFDVTVLSSPTSPIHNCFVNNGTGTISGQAISNVEVSCDNLDLIFKNDLEATNN